jgi:hypothetical protein
MSNNYKKITITWLSPNLLEVFSVPEITLIMYGESIVWMSIESPENPREKIRKNESKKGG